LKAGEYERQLYSDQSEASLLLALIRCFRSSRLLKCIGTFAAGARHRPVGLDYNAEGFSGRKLFYKDYLPIELEFME